MGITIKRPPVAPKAGKQFTESVSPIERGMSSLFNMFMEPNLDIGPILGGNIIKFPKKTGKVIGGKLRLGKKMKTVDIDKPQFIGRDIDSITKEVFETKAPFRPKFGADVVDIKSKTARGEFRRSVHVAVDEMSDEWAIENFLKTKGNRSAREAVRMLSKEEGREIRLVEFARRFAKQDPKVIKILDFIKKFPIIHDD